MRRVIGTPVALATVAMTLRRSTLFVTAVLLASSSIACVGDDDRRLPVIPPIPAVELDAGPGVTKSAEGGAVADDAAPPPAPETALTRTPAALSNDAKPVFEFSSADAVAFACKVDGAEPAPCTSPYAVTIGEGSHTFVVAAVSAAGVVDETPATFSWSTDLTPPKTTISKAPAALDNSVDVDFEFAATETAKFECSLDGAAFVTCTSPYAVKALADGAHTFTVRAIDDAGNVESTSPAVSFSIVTALPDTTIGSGPTGSVASKSASFTFSSPNAGAGATFACSLDGAAFAPCTSPFDASTLSEGAHTFQVRVTDAAKNVDPTPAERKWTVDTVAPIVTIASGPTGTTADAQPQFDFTQTGGSVVECKLDAGSYAACTSPFKAPSALADGSHTLYVRARDAANNEAIASRSFTVDTVAPTVAISAGPQGPTNDSTPTFTFTSGGASQIQCRFGSAAFAACTSPFTPAAPLADGAYTFEVRGLDAANNVASATRAFTVDTAAPVVTVSGGPSGATNDTTPTFSFTTSGSPSAVACRIGTAAPFVACTSPFTPAALTDGSYTLYVRATDAAGNAATASRNFSVDTTAPSVAITGGPTGTTNVAAPTFTFTAAGASATQCRASGIQFDTGFAPCTSPYVPTLAGSRDYTIEVRAIDAVGNAATASRTFAWDIDLPVVTIVTGPSGPTNNPNVSFGWSAYDIGSASTTTQCRIGTGPFTGCNSGSYAATLGDGSYTFEVQMIDLAGNVGSATRSFTIDTTPPAVAVTSAPDTYFGSPNTFQFTAEAGAATACRIYQMGTTPGGFTACTSPWTVTMPYVEAAFYFEVRATDAVGNSASSIASFVVCNWESCMVQSPP